MELVCSSEMSVDLYRTKLRYIHTLHVQILLKNYPCEILLQMLLAIWRWVQSIAYMWIKPLDEEGFRSQYLFIQLMTGMICKSKYFWRLCIIINTILDTVCRVEGFHAQFLETGSVSVFTFKRGNIRTSIHLMMEADPV